MRFILTACIWIIIVGGLWLYTQQRQQAEAGLERSEPQLVVLEQQWDLLLTPTFSVEPDPFALQVTDEQDTAFEIRINGEPVPVAVDNLQRGVPLRVTGVTGLVAGQNEIFVQASPPLEESGRSHGIRIQLSRGDTSSQLDQTIWAGEGALVMGTLNFALTAQGETEDAHEH